jgi:hypothetical protein
VWSIEPVRRWPGEQVAEHEVEPSVWLPVGQFDARLIEIDPDHARDDLAQLAREHSFPAADVEGSLARGWHGANVGACDQA